MAKGDRTFISNIGILYDDIRSAAQWGSPSILIAVTDDHWVKEKAIRSLHKKLISEAGLSVEVINFADINQDKFVAKINSLTSKTSIYFATNLLQPQKDTAAEQTYYYRALNMQREAFVEANVRIIFWLNTKEAGLLPIAAPDFWAFRHQVIKFFSSRSRPNPHFLSRLILWHDPIKFKDNSPNAVFNEIEKKTALLDPAGDIRTDDNALLYSDLTKLCWEVDDYEGCDQYSTKGLGIEPLPPNPDNADLWIGRATVLLKSGDIKSAEEILRRLQSTFFGDPVMDMNMAILLTATSKKAGLALGNKNLRSIEQSPTLLSRLGYLCFLSGKLEDASRYFSLADDADPNPEYKIAAAVSECKADRRFDMPQDIEDQKSSISKACFSFCRNQHEHGLKILAEMPDSEKIPKTALLADRNLWMSVYPETLEEVML